jgi:hypothetical protein
VVMLGAIAVILNDTLPQTSTVAAQWESPS